MPKLLYESKRFGASTRQMIRIINDILDAYAAQGYDLTLRQLYYQCVARDLFPDDRTWSQDPRTKRWYRDEFGTKNAEPNYKWLGGIVNDARLAGYIDWERIVDRSRNVQRRAHWDDPASIIQATASSFKVDLWEDQPRYVEAWIEKEALIDVLARACNSYDVPYFACKGYTSQSEMWGASRRFLDARLAGKKVTIVHLGDHDPSGIDMTRDIEDRTRTFVGYDYIREHADRQGINLSAPPDGFIERLYTEGTDGVEVRRVALTMDQITEYDPPPNPAKTTDARFESYLRDYGDESWELDALDPTVLSDLVQEEIEDLIEDREAWDASREREREGKDLLRRASDDWDRIAEELRD